jgi:hypothetical protein
VTWYRLARVAMWTALACAFYNATVGEPVLFLAMLLTAAVAYTASRWDES